MAHDFSENSFIDWKLFVGGNYRGPWGKRLLSSDPHSVVVNQNCLLWMQKAMRCFRSECDCHSVVSDSATPRAVAHQASLSV